MQSNSEYHANTAILSVLLRNRWFLPSSGPRISSNGIVSRCIAQDLDPGYDTLATGWRIHSNSQYTVGRLSKRTCTSKKGRPLRLL